MEAITADEHLDSGSVELEEALVDPVAYLRSLGIDAELVAVLVGPMAPAA